MTSLSDLLYSSFAFLHIVYSVINYLLAMAVSVVLIIAAIYLYVMAAILKRYPTIFVWPLTFFLIGFSGIIFGYKYGGFEENKKWEALAKAQQQEYNAKLLELNTSIGQITDQYQKDKANFQVKRVELEGKLAKANLNLDNSKEFDTFDAKVHDDSSQILNSITLDKLNKPTTQPKVVTRVENHVQTQVKYVKVDIPKNYCQNKTVPKDIRDLIDGAGK